jgi:membrane carboxypeptidase/penicillin-binding protein
VVTGVWVGYDLKKPIGYSMTGAAAALPIWIDAMKAATRGDEPAEFEIPPGVVRLEVCSETGLPASPECPLGEMEMFLADRIPRQQCYLHGAFMDLRLRERWDTYRDVQDWGSVEEEREGKTSPP